jgi:hypothetical protein
MFVGNRRAVALIKDEAKKEGYGNQEGTPLKVICHNRLIH